MPKPFSIDGRSTGRGAFTDATIIRPDGSEYEPERTETSRTGKHWTSDGRWWTHPAVVGRRRRQARPL